MNEFVSGLATQIQGLLELKHAMGLPYEESGRHLHKFDEMCDRDFPGQSTLTRDMAMGWVVLRSGEHVNGQIRRITPVRQLAKYMASLGADAYVIPKGIPGRQIHYRPHIFSHRELRALFDASDAIQASPYGGQRQLIIPVMFRMIYCLGLRRTMKSDDFFTLVRSWLTSYLPRSRRLSPHTIRSYKAALNTLLAFLGETRHLKLEQIGFETITYSSMSEFIAWLMDARHLSASTANQRLAAIKSFLSYCAGEEPALVATWLDVKRVRPARAPERVPDALGMAAVEAIIRTPGQQTAHGQRDTLLILLLFDAAARIQEVLDLAPSDIVTTSGSSAVTLTGKGHKTRTVPIMDKTGRHVEQYLKVFHPDPTAQGTWLFYTVRAGEQHQMSQDNVAYMLNKYAAIARAQCPEVPEQVHAHQLRHSRAMQMLRAGVPLPHIKEFLGHANISTTEIYASADNQMVREAIQKAASGTPDLAPIWKGPDDLILRLAGLK